MPQPKTSADQNVPQHQKATVQGVQSFMEAMGFTKTSWRILSNDKYLMVEESWKQASKAQDCQRTVASAPVGTQSVCQLLSGPPSNIDPQTHDTVSLAFYLMLLYQISHIDYASKYT